METARDLNIDTDEIQLVVSALRGVGIRIVEVADTHKPLFAGELFLMGKGVYERLYISPHTLQDYRDRRIRYSIRIRTWKDCWERTIPTDND